MDEEMDTSVDTSSFDDTSSDCSDTSSDIGEIMDDSSFEAADTFDEADFSDYDISDDTSEVDDLMSDTSDEYIETTDASDFDSDVAEDDSEEIESLMDDTDTDEFSEVSDTFEEADSDVESDIVDLMDEAAFEDDDEITDVPAEEVAETDEISALMDEDTGDTTDEIPESSEDADIVEDLLEETEDQIDDGLADAGVDNAADITETNEETSEAVSDLPESDASGEPTYLTMGEFESILRSSDRDALERLRQDVEAGNIQVYSEVDDTSGEAGRGRVLTRDTNEQLEIGNNAIENNIEAMRDDLRDKGLEDGPQMESIVMRERARMQDELQRNIDGDFSDPYIKPDFDEVLANGEFSDETIEADEPLDVEAPIVDVPTEIDCEAVYRGLDEYDFDGIDYSIDTERLDASLDNFDSSTWEQLSIDEQKSAIRDLADYVEETIGFDNPPEIVYYNEPVEEDYGRYNSSSNTLEINEYMLYNNEEAADTVAHELWHAYQFQRASNPQSAKDYMYQYGFENYISYEDDFKGYRDQLIEAEARAFAEQFKDRLNTKGRRI